MTPEEMDEYYDYDNILARMLDSIEEDVDKREGSVIYNAIAPVAVEFAQMYFILKNNTDLCFADTAVGEYLNRLSNQIGIDRKSATNAIKQAFFYDENEELFDVGLGQRFSVDDLIYTTIERVEKGKYKVECETAGRTGNDPTGTLVPVDYIEHLGRAEIKDIIIPGEDEETDEELRERYFAATNEKAFCGNIADYKKETKEIDGVGAVKVFPVWNGGGTVKLTILDSEFNKASSELISKVQKEMCPEDDDTGMGIAPVGHLVTVDTVTELEIKISARVTSTESEETEKLKQSITSEINNYLLELKKNWENEENLIVRISQIEARILNISSVIDITNTKLNEGTTNIELNSTQIPVLKEVILE